MAKRRKSAGSAEDGPRPRDLTRTRIIEAALVLIDRKGPETVTMRAVADALGVTAMALYNHFGCKDDLLRAMAAQILEAARFDVGAGDWRSQVEACFREFRAVCLRHPGLPRLLETADVAPEAVFAPMEVTLRALGQAGLGDIDGLRAYFTLVGFTLAQTSYQSRGPVASLEPSDRIAGHGYEAVEGLEMPETWDFKAAFEYGLRLILDGVECAAARA